jgi:hypothetical protein
MSARERWCGVARGKFRVIAEFEFGAATGLGVFFDPHVLRTGCDAVVRSIDLDIALLWLQLSVYYEWPVRPYRDGETVMDAFLALDEEAAQ